MIDRALELYREYCPLGVPFVSVRELPCGLFQGSVGWYDGSWATDIFTVKGDKLRWVKRGKVNNA